MKKTSTKQKIAKHKPKITILLFFSNMNFFVTNGRVQQIFSRQVMVETSEKFILVRAFERVELNDRIICLFNRNIGTYQNRPFCAAKIGLSYHSFVLGCALIMQFIFIFFIWSFIEQLDLVRLGVMEVMEIVWICEPFEKNIKCRLVSS